MAKDAIGREVKDNSAEQMQALQGELTKLLNKLVDELAPGAGRYSVECLGREYGDNSWVIAIDGPSMGGKDLKGFYGRVRTGNAIVDIKGTGTYSRDWMLEQLDYVMGVVEDSTAMFGEDDWR